MHSVYISLSFSTFSALQFSVQNNSETHITWPLFSKIEDDDDGFQRNPTIQNHRYLERLRYACFSIPFEIFIICFFFFAKLYFLLKRTLSLDLAHCLHTTDPTMNIFVCKSYAIWKLSFRFFFFSYYCAKCFQFPKNENRLTINVTCAKWSSSFSFWNGAKKERERKKRNERTEKKTKNRKKEKSQSAA